MGTTQKTAVCSRRRADRAGYFHAPRPRRQVACPTDEQPPHHDQTGRRVCVPTRWPYATYAPDSLGFFYAQVGSSSVGILQVLLHPEARLHHQIAPTSLAFAKTFRSEMLWWRRGPDLVLYTTCTGTMMVIWVNTMLVAGGRSSIAGQPDYELREKEERKGA